MKNKVRLTCSAAPLCQFIDSRSEFFVSRAHIFAIDVAVFHCTTIVARTTVKPAHQPNHFCAIDVNVCARAAPATHANIRCKWLTARNVVALFYCTSATTPKIRTKRILDRLGRHIPIRSPAQHRHRMATEVQRITNRLNNAHWRNGICCGAGRHVIHRSTWIQFQTYSAVALDTCVRGTRTFEHSGSDFWADYDRISTRTRIKWNLIRINWEQTRQMRQV